MREVGNFFLTIGLLVIGTLLLNGCVGNYPPVAVATANPTSGNAPLTVTFDGSESSDPEGRPLTYDWDFGDGTTGTGVTVSHTYGDDGLYTATLTVTDDLGQTDQTSLLITVTNPAPTASFTYSPSNPKVGETVTFDASGSVDPAAIEVRAQSITSYEWDFGDGTTCPPNCGLGTTQTPTHVYNDARDFTVTLTVTDDDEASGTAIQSVAVACPFPASCEVLFVYKDPPGGSYDPELIAQLAAKGCSVDELDTGTDSLPADLSPYDVVLAFSYDLGPTDAALLKDYIAQGGGVVIMGGVPYYLAGGTTNLAPISDWLGVSTYTNAGWCITANAIVDKPFDPYICPPIGLGEIVGSSSCQFGGAAAYAGTQVDTTVVAEWQQAPALIFAFTHTYGLGRVYGQAQFLNPPYDVEPHIGRDYDLLIGGIFWAIGGAADP